MQYFVRRPREQRFTPYGDRCIHGRVSQRFAAFSHELAASGSSSRSSTTIPNNSNINSSSNIPLQKEVEKAKKGSCTLREMKEDDAFVETEKAKKNRKGLLAMPKASISSSNIPLQKEVEKAKKGSCTLREMKEDDAFVETEKAKKNRKGLLAMPKASIRKNKNRRRRAALQLELERLELDLGDLVRGVGAPWSSELATRAAQIANAILIEDEDLCVRVAAAQDAVDELTEHV